MGQSLRCYIPSFVEICPLVQKKILEGFLPYADVNKLCSPYPQNLALTGQAVLEKKMFEIVDGRITTDGRLSMPIL